MALHAKLNQRDHEQFCVFRKDGIALVGLFASGPTALLTGVAFLSWWISEFIGAQLIPALRRRGQHAVGRDRGSAGVVILSVYVAIAIAFGFGYSGTTPIPDIFFYIGIVLIFLGIIVRQWAIAVLGRFFALTVRVAQDHKLVEKGPYRLVRHPSYTGTLVTLIGIGLAVQSWAALIALLVMFGLAYGYRIRIEEKALKSQLGQDYLNYMQRTKRLLPYLI